jgi:hypothetical protein
MTRSLNSLGVSLLSLFSLRAVAFLIMDFNIAVEWDESLLPASEGGLSSLSVERFVWFNTTDFFEVERID